MSLEDAVRETVESELNSLLHARRDEVATMLIEVFGGLRKKPVEDLPQRCAAFNQRIQKMVEDLTVKFVDGKVVVRASGSGELTLRLLKAGGQWFDPMPDVNDRIMRGLYT